MGKNKLIKGIFKLLRPTHYIKNLFVFLPLFFSGQFTHHSLLWEACASFICFCLIASSIYIFNDIIDIDEDRKHPENKWGPIASGVVSIRIGYLVDIILSVCGFVFAFFVNHNLFFVLIAYKLINILYTLILKRISIIDVLTLSLGFVLRLYAGSVTTGVELSVWIIILTFLLSMLLVIRKRRNDVLYFEQEDILLRHAIRGYNSEFLNYTMVLLSSVIIVAYIMYTVSPEVCIRVGTNSLFVTVFWVLAGILRYLQLLFVFNAKDNPVKLLYKDHPLKLILGSWLFSFLFLFTLVELLTLNKTTYKYEISP